MLVNVQDNFRPTGLVRKHPYLMTAQGIRGNEYTSTHWVNHTTRIPFSRMLTEATHYTICFKECEKNYPSKLKTLKGHQFAPESCCLLSVKSKSAKEIHWIFINH
ncbi:glycoside hydrolase family 97 catalytic domain-containing protein [Thermophagus sp. OGC60D27]|uniref:glycoside hydrolase family 97 catalytic domain-containing protein n=1 Tax=Thermophagus sp. OGC60D27 TaxID=3458415 RepID=UPI004037A677